MKLRADYARTEFVTFDSVPWTASPEGGIERKMLERDGEEVARATSIVRYAGGSAFSEHAHERGEEFFVLEGTFQDEHGSYPEGTYVRNPPGSRHRPFSTGGCMIFVKLRQFAEGDDVRRVVTREQGTWIPNTNCSVKALHAYADEWVGLVELAAGSHLVIPACETGLEMLVIRGSIGIGDVRCLPFTWLRLRRLALAVESESGCVFWLKQGHLP
jgi:hypothetical protein